MGLRDRLKGLIKRVVEEGGSPGQPPPHKAADSAAWRPGVAPESQQPKPMDATESPWYLQGEQADPGWDQTNPSTEANRK